MSDPPPPIIHRMIGEPVRCRGALIQEVKVRVEYGKLPDGTPFVKSYVIDPDGDTIAWLVS
jgi:hypothetical protein